MCLIFFVVYVYTVLLAVRDCNWKETCRHVGKLALIYCYSPCDPTGMYVCIMYECMYVSMYVCIYMYVYMCVCVCLCVYMYVFKYLCMYECMCACIYVCFI
jgi:hypothetical protein